jgi:hypothetical protein
MFVRTSASPAATLAAPRAVKVILFPLVSAISVTT